MTMDRIDVRLPIKLGQFVKLACLADTGAEARELIASGQIEVNGIVETRRGHHLSDGDAVTLVLPGNDVSVRVHAVD